MAQEKRFPWLVVVGVLGCVGVLCVGILALGGGAAYFALRPAERVVSTLPPAEVVEPLASPTADEGVEPQPSATVAEAAAEPAPSPTPEPTQPEPTDSGPELTGEQRLDESSLFDDFSSDALGWPVYEDGSTIMGYEDGAYSIQILEPNYYDWAFIPVDFAVREIWFDVQGPEGPQDGTFGVFCQFIDVDNYSYVEFDLADNSYVIGQIVAGENIPLTAENEAGQFWHVAEALKTPPTAVNRIGVSCYPQSITLHANDQWVDDVTITQVFDQPGEAAFFVYTFDFAEAGYKVFFDNVEVWLPRN